MMCLIKRVLPLVFGLAAGIFLVFLFKTEPKLTIQSQSAFSGEPSQINVAPAAPLGLTRDEMEAFFNHNHVGLCHSYAKPIDILETVADNQLTSKAKILYLPKPDSWKKQSPCTRCLLMLRATLDASGRVTSIIPMSIDPHAESVNADAQCKKDVLEAVQQIQFEPAMKNGKPASQLVTIIYDKWGSGY